MSYSKKTYIDSIITITAVVLNIGLNYIYIPKYGYEASAITTIISYAFMFIMFYFNAKYFLKYRVINIFIISKIILSYFILLLVFLYINMIIDNYLVLLFIKFILINSYLIYNYWDNITQFKNEKKWLK